MGTDVHVRLGAGPVAGGEADVDRVAVEVDGDGEVEVLGPQLGFADGAVGESGSEAVELARGEGVPCAEPLRRCRVDGEVGVGSERREVVADPRSGDSMIPSCSAAARSVVIGASRSGSTISRSPRTAMREPSSNGGVPMPSPVDRSPMRPVRALRAGEIA
jgi:hypothetical protein